MEKQHCYTRTTPRSSSLILKSLHKDWCEVIYRKDKNQQSPHSPDFLHSLHLMTMYICLLFGTTANSHLVPYSIITIIMVLLRLFEVKLHNSNHCNEIEIKQSCVWNPLLFPLLLI